jgi:hypothetical protein
MNEACAEKYACYGPPWTLSKKSEFIWCLVALYIAAVVYFVVFLYLDQVLPSEYGVTKHPLFCFIDLNKKENKSKKHSKTKYIINDESNVGEEQRLLLSEGIVISSNGSILACCICFCLYSYTHTHTHTP